MTSVDALIGRAIDAHAEPGPWASLLLGIHLMPEGQRRRRLAEQETGLLAEEFAGRVLGFDLSSAPAYAAIASQREQAGHRINSIDGVIAATARSTVPPWPAGIAILPAAAHR